MSTARPTLAAEHREVTGKAVSRLRQAVDREFDRPLIHTVRGVGYTLRA